MESSNTNEDLSESARDILSSIPDIFEDLRHIWNTPSPSPAPRDISTPAPYIEDSHTPIPSSAEQPAVRPVLRVTPYIAPRVGHNLAYISPQIAQDAPPVSFLHAYLETQIHVLSPSLWQFFVFGRMDYMVGDRIVVIDICLSKFVSIY